MTKTSMRSTLLGACLMLTGCATPPQSPNPITRIDEIPMYGGIDRSQIPEAKAADEKFIADVSQQYGSRERAAQLWVNQGYRFYQQDQLGMAMRRFNQAWLLNPKNPEAYTGMASVLNDQKKYCAAARLMDTALSLSPPSFQGIYPDAGRVYSLCATTDGTLDSQKKAELIARSEAVYQKGETLEPNKKYLYNSWASTYYSREQYADSWAMVAKARKAGGEPSPAFMKRLREKMPEPAEN